MVLPLLVVTVGEPVVDAAACEAEIITTPEPPALADPVVAFCWPPPPPFPVLLPPADGAELVPPLPPAE